MLSLSVSILLVLAAPSTRAAPTALMLGPANRIVLGSFSDRSKSTALCGNQVYEVQSSLCCGGKVYRDQSALFTCCGATPCLTNVGLQVYNSLGGRLPENGAINTADLQRAMMVPQQGPPPQMMMQPPPQPPQGLMQPPPPLQPQQNDQMMMGGASDYYWQPPPPPAPVPQQSPQYQMYDSGYYDAMGQYPGQMQPQAPPPPPQPYYQDTIMAPEPDIAPPMIDDQLPGTSEEMDDISEYLRLPPEQVQYFARGTHATVPRSQSRGGNHHHQSHQSKYGSFYNQNQPQKSNSYSSYNPLSALNSPNHRPASKTNNNGDRQTIIGKPSLFVIGRGGNGATIMRTIPNLVVKGGGLTLGQLDANKYFIN